MTRAEFVELMDAHYEQITSINRTKGADYSGSEDALSNFKRQAKSLGLSPEQVLAVYLSKHYDAVMTFCREGQVESEPIEGRVHDVILYCFLLLGLIEEHKAPLEMPWADTLAKELNEARKLEEAKAALKDRFEAQTTWNQVKNLDGISEPLKDAHDLWYENAKRNLDEATKSN